MSRYVGTLVFVGLTLLLAMMQLLISYSNLPDQVPSHFGMNGQPDRWMSKNGYMLMIGCIQLVTIGFMFLMGVLIKILPTDLINLPNKYYWLAESRRETTIEQIQCDMLIIGAITCWLVIGISHLTCRVASGASDTIGPYSWWLVGLYMIAIFGYCGMLVFRYRSNPELKKG